MSVITDYRLVNDDGIISMAHIIDPPNGPRRFLNCSCLAGNNIATVREIFAKWEIAMIKPVLRPADFENSEDFL